MKNQTKIAFLILTMIAGIVLTENPARAHSFNVALVISLPDAAPVQGIQIREGFMLATTERDSHPDQESDGHLGGLDTYVTVINSTGDVGIDITRIVAQDEIDIVVVFGPEASVSAIGNLFDGEKAALLSPGRSPFSESERPDVAAFISAYESVYGYKPSSHAAQGYNAARRIDMAVRMQGGVADTASLLRSFSDTARGFTW
ncbi:MAG: hypothetical protein H8E30_03105 [Alphaproteobacteria bacterium]|nr:hypothetical protein [Alphaproteobacteria bacterium]